MFFLINIFKTDLAFKRTLACDQRPSLSKASFNENIMGFFFPELAVFDKVSKIIYYNN